MARGALATDPRGVRVSPGVYRNAQGKTYQSKTGALGRDPRPKKKPATAPGVVNPPPGTEGAPAQNPTYSVDPDPNFDMAMGNVFQRFGQQGEFDPNLPEIPQDYGAMRQKSEQMAMDSFERNMNPQFQREEADFRQRMAEQGVPETSEGYQRQYMDMKNQQNAARQNAATSAFQAGQGEQAQAWGQAMQGRQNAFGEQFQSYQLPMAQMNAMSPYYASNLQNQQFNNNLGFLGGQNDMNRQHDFDLAKQQNKFARQQMRLGAQLNPRGGGGGGGGGGSPAGQFDKTFDNMMLQYMTQPQQQQPQYPGYAGGFFQGLGQGTPMGLMSGLKGGS